MKEYENNIKNREEEMEIDLVLLFKDFWKSFTRLWWVVLLLVLLGSGSCFSYYYFGYEPIYESKATFTVATGDKENGSYNFYYNSSTADQLSKTFPYILDSNFFKSTLLERIGKDELNGDITSETIENSNMVTMKVYSSNPQDAKEILDAALEIYPETARFVLGSIQFDLLDEPETPTQPYNQMGIIQSLVLGGGIGGLLGILLLGVNAFFRKTAKTPEEMRKITSLRCLATVPQIHFKARKKQKKQKISVLDKRISYGYRESLRALQLRLENGMKKDQGKVLLISSTSSGEGKSTLAVNLAELFADQGKKVLLIDGDLRKQDDAEIIGIKNDIGLQDIVIENTEAKAMVQKIKENGIWFLGSQTPVKQPASILSNFKVREFILDMKEEMDYIIIDTPPCEIFQDAGILADYADHILYVVKYDCVPQRRIWEGISFLGGHNAKFLGYVFNHYPESVSEYGYGKYGYKKYGYQFYGKRKSYEGEYKNN